MKKFFKILLWIVIVLAAIILIGGLLLPSNIEVSVSKEMKADQKPIFDYVNNLKANAAWSPWEGVSDIKFGDKFMGEGASMSWNDEMGGSGKQTITESKPYTLVKTDLDFGDQGIAKADFILDEMEDGVKATWTFESDASYPLERWFSILFIKPMIQKSYEKGLAKLDSVALKPPKWISMKIQEVKSTPLLSIRVTSTKEDIAKNMSEIFSKLGKYMGENKITPIAPPITIWHSWSGKESDMEIGFPISKEVEGSGDIKTSKTYEGKVATYMHEGAYDKSFESWETLMKVVDDINMESNGSPYEIYITSPESETDTTKWKTKLFMPVK